MKIRTDFVTNSSSANYILELDLTNNAEQTAQFYLAVSPETIYSKDGAMTAKDIRLVPNIEQDQLAFNGNAISGAESLEELCDMLFCAAEIFGWRDMKDDEDDEQVEDIWDAWDDESAVSVRDVAPKTIADFLRKCKKQNITPENLKTIVIKNEKYGAGDSAMYIKDESLLDAFEAYYEKLAEEQKQDKLQALVDFVKSEPVVRVCDNEHELPDTMVCVWETSDDKLKKKMASLLKGNRSKKYFMGTYADEYIIDFKSKSMQSRELFYFGNL